MSLCQSWFGSARSKRRSGLSRRSTGSCSTSKPDSWRMRRTVVSETPKPSKRASTSRMRRVPHSGFAARAPTTLRRAVFDVALRLRATAAPDTRKRSASTPPLSNNPMNFWMTATDTPNATATSACLVPRITAWTMRSRTSNGTGPFRFTASCGLRPRFFFATCSLLGPPLSRVRGRQVLCERQLTKRHIAGARHSHWNGVVVIGHRVLRFGCVR